MTKLRLYQVLFLLVLFSNPACTQEILQRSGDQDIITIQASPTANPVFKRNEFNPVVRVELKLPEGGPNLTLSSLEGQMESSTLKMISKLEVFLSSDPNSMVKGKPIGWVIPSGKNFTIPIKGSLNGGQHYIWLNVVLKDNATMDAAIQLKVNRLTDSSRNNYAITQNGLTNQHIGFMLRKPMDDGSKAYRIPGLTTTDKGTLIAVYDIRYDHSGDLPANIDVGMSRSTDGGRSWSPMKTIMDMGGPKDNSGVGDPAVMYDPATKTIWVAALWSKGNRSIAGSGPGLSPDETGQFLITSSKDDGITWSKPYSITQQVKDPKWRIFFPAPGSGIVMSDGKLVFAAQYWDANKVPHSTLVYSADHGKTWKSGLGAKSNTTESQLVEIEPGTLLLNMRDNRGKFRSLATTKDMGQNWTEHPTSNHTLPDPVCMGSFIKARVKVKGKLQDVLFFSNPNVSLEPRRDITIKASLDNGLTWEPANSLLIDERHCDGYSSLTKIDDNTLGLLYEGLGRIQYLRVPVKDIVK